jgi:hypothetical protein
MEKALTSFEYESLILSLKPQIWDEEKDRGDIDGVKPSSTWVLEDPRDFKGGKDSPER